MRHIVAVNYISFVIKAKYLENKGYKITALSAKDYV